MRFIALFLLLFLFFGCLSEQCPTTYEPVCAEDGTTYPNLCMAENADLGIIYNGTCDDLSCDDSDRGKDVKISGAVHSDGEVIHDRCIDTATVLEFFCKSGYLSNESITCPKGSICSAGSCIYNHSGTVHQTICKDSDGKNLSIKGTLTIGGKAFNDSCVGSHLIEYSCKENIVQSNLHFCPNGCLNGSCISQKCRDTEEGRSIFNTGTVSLIDDDNRLLYTDGCVDELTLTEFSCNGNILSASNVSCPEGFFCSRGSCRPVSICHDTDAGEKDGRYSKGTVYFRNATYVDRCENGSLTEFSCGDGEFIENILQCPDGYRCSEGKCIESSKCFETDGGKNYGEKGVSIEPSGYSAEDECVDEISLFEYFCDSRQLISSERYVCPQGYSCLEGACIKSEDCSDPDQGINYYVTGATKIGNTHTHEDYCSNNTLTEFYCDNGRIRSIVYACPLGYQCKAGSCMPYCTDTDGGDNPGELGQLRYGGELFADYCDGNKLFEFTCSEDNMIYNINTHECPLCRGGLCFE